MGALVLVQLTGRPLRGKVGPRPPGGGERLRVERSGSCGSAPALAGGGAVVGGSWGTTVGGPNHISDLVEVYDPLAERWTTVAPLTEARAATTAAVLEDGRVWIAGGAGGRPFFDHEVGSAEVLDLPLPALRH